MAVAFRCAANIVPACSGLGGVGMVPSWDLEVCRQLGESLNEGLTLDQALHECVKGPTLSTLLQLLSRCQKGTR